MPEAPVPVHDDAFSILDPPAIFRLLLGAGLRTVAKAGPATLIGSLGTALGTFVGVWVAGVVLSALLG
ncbi:DUF819 family protein [Rubrivirga marina]|uniref:Uncharacterized protein n=1 Tax=Rubrivirga marina TaxID=1196024 RepID=A0A271IVP7_9BACT|nr:DUF819 family protein [Rubrivirga marina]PAP75326.1 hypothetical protein BSZ37_02135 [Rubrivirga marina]